VIVANCGGREQELLLQSEANHRCPVETARKNPLSALLLDVYLTHPFLLPNDLDLMAQFVRESNARRNSFNQNKWRRRV
jgi:hypothetical protein